MANANTSYMDVAKQTMNAIDRMSPTKRPLYRQQLMQRYSSQESSELSTGSFEPFHHPRSPHIRASPTQQPILDRRCTHFSSCDIGHNPLPHHQICLDTRAHPERTSPQSSISTHHRSREIIASRSICSADFPVKKRIGRGSFGNVYLCSCSKEADASGSCVVKKVELMGLKKEELNDVLSEVNLMSQVNHPNIIRFYASFVEDDVMHIVMEYAVDGDLSSLMEQLHAASANLKGRDVEVVAWDVLTQQTCGLLYLHGQNIIHRDVKPQNILVTRCSQGYQVFKLADLGFGKLLTSGSALATSHVGTPLYMAPEIYAGEEYTAAVDIWSLGCVIFQTCTNKTPFSARNMQRLRGVIVKETAPELPTDFSVELQFLVSLMLHKAAHRRPSAQQILTYPGTRVRAQLIDAQRKMARLESICAQQDTLLQKLKASAAEWSSEAYAWQQIAQHHSQQIDQQQVVSTNDRHQRDQTEYNFQVGTPKRQYQQVQQATQQHQKTRMQAQQPDTAGSPISSHHDAASFSDRTIQLPTRNVVADRKCNNSTITRSTVKAVSSKEAYDVLKEAHDVRAVQETRLAAEQQRQTEKFNRISLQPQQKIPILSQNHQGPSDNTRVRKVSVISPSQSPTQLEASTNVPACSNDTTFYRPEIRSSNNASAIRKGFSEKECLHFTHLGESPRSATLLNHDMLQESTPTTLSGQHSSLSVHHETHGDFPFTPTAVNHRSQMTCNDANSFRGDSKIDLDNNFADEDVLSPSLFERSETNTPVRNHRDERDDIPKNDISGNVGCTDNACSVDDLLNRMNMALCRTRVSPIKPIEPEFESLETENSEMSYGWVQKKKEVNDSKKRQDIRAPTNLAPVTHPLKKSLFPSSDRHTYTHIDTSGIHDKSQDDFTQKSEQEETLISSLKHRESRKQRVKLYYNDQSDKDDANKLAQYFHSDKVNCVLDTGDLHSQHKSTDLDAVERNTLLNRQSPSICRNVFKSNHATSDRCHVFEPCSSLSDIRQSEYEQQQNVLSGEESDCYNTTSPAHHSLPVSWSSDVQSPLESDNEDDRADNRHIGEHTVIHKRTNSLKPTLKNEFIDIHKQRALTLDNRRDDMISNVKHGNNLNFDSFAYHENSISVALQEGDKPPRCLRSSGIELMQATNTNEKHHSSLTQITDKQERLLISNTQGTFPRLSPVSGTSQLFSWDSSNETTNEHEDDYLKIDTHEQEKQSCNLEHNKEQSEENSTSIRGTGQHQDCLPYDGHDVSNAASSSSSSGVSVEIWSSFVDPLPSSSSLLHKSPSQAAYALLSPSHVKEKKLNARHFDQKPVDSKTPNNNFDTFAVTDNRDQLSRYSYFGHVVTKNHYGKVNVTWPAAGDALRVSTACPKTHEGQQNMHAVSASEYQQPHQHPQQSTIFRDSASPLIEPRDTKTSANYQSRMTSNVIKPCIDYHLINRTKSSEQGGQQQRKNVGIGGTNQDYRLPLADRDANTISHTGTPLPKTTYVQVSSQQFRNMATHDSEV